jgi:hypothetical protein
LTRRIAANIAKLPELLRPLAANAPLLLGQSFLSRFKSRSIDNAKQALVLAQ